VRHKALHGVAWLQKRNGDYLQSLQTYLQIINTEVDLLQLMREVTTFQKSKQMAYALYEKL
jgi:hypothetical protein